MDKLATSFTSKVCFNYASFDLQLWVKVKPKIFHAKKTTKDTFSEFFYKIVFVEWIVMSNFIFIKNFLQNACIVEQFSLEFFCCGTHWSKNQGGVGRCTFPLVQCSLLGSNGQPGSLVTLDAMGEIPEITICVMRTCVYTWLEIE